MVWEKEYYPTYYFPREDVRMKHLVSNRQTSNGRQIFNVTVGEQKAEAGAWSFPNPSRNRQFLENHIAFNWKKMDHWYEEEEEVFVHARNPYVRVDAIKSSRHIRVKINGVLVAESDRPVLVFETNLPTRYYLPKEDVRMDLLQATQAQTACPYKGTASYWSVKIGEETHRNIVWAYEDPYSEVSKIKGLLSFFNEKVDIYDDGELVSKVSTVRST
jgi:uncharacterized protein (DUF427 family)